LLEDAEARGKERYPPEHDRTLASLFKGTGYGFYSEKVGHTIYISKYAGMRQSTESYTTKGSQGGPKSKRERGTYRT